jgi:hypothetical protein
MTDEERAKELSDKLNYCLEQIGDTVQLAEFAVDAITDAFREVRAGAWEEAAEKANLLHPASVQKWMREAPYDRGYDSGAREQARASKERLKARAAAIRAGKEET